MIKKIDVFIIIINIIFFAYYSIQLLVFTDEFALNNLGFFNHAVAGLSEIIGIIGLIDQLSYLEIGGSQGPGAKTKMFLLFPVTPKRMILVQNQKLWL